MPNQRPSDPSRSGGRRTPANERRKPAFPRGENPYKRAAKTETAAGSRGRSAAPVRKDWGSLTRKGAEAMKENGPGRASSRIAEREEKPPSRNTDRWQRADAKPKQAKPRSQGEAFRLPPEAILEIEERAGRKADRLVKYLKEASKAYAAERWGDVRKSLRPLLAEVGDAPVVIELNGMLMYRTGKWAAALKELEAAHKDTQSYDLYPAMMDANRALKKSARVKALWDELREAAPSGEVMAEGRIVMASSMADDDRLQDAIRLMDKTPKVKGEPKLYHLRSWYLQADLYERIGDVGRARQLFEKVAGHDPELADVLERIDALA